MANRPNEVDLDVIVQNRRFKFSIIMSILVVSVVIISCWIYRGASGTLESETALKQMENSDESYIVGQLAATSNPSLIIITVGFITLTMVWLPYILCAIRRKLSMKSILSIVICFFSIVTIGCGDYKEELLVEIEPDETAFMIALEGNTEENQEKFESVEFLEKRKVASKRISIPQREKSTGRMWWSYEWIPSARVIKIKRAPVTREWTNDPSTGTSSKSEKLQVESLDSVGFSVGATIMCSIQEDDAARFLYYFNGKQLEDIIDNNIRGYAQMELAQRFGALKLEECKAQKGKIFKEVESLVKNKFEDMGITTSYFGSSEGLTYENPDIQKAIDAQVQSEARIQTEMNEKLAADEENKKKIAAAVAVAEAEKQSAQQELEAQRVRNQRLIEEAEAKATAANKLLSSKEAVLLELEVHIKRKEAEAKVEAAKSLKEVRILPAGSALLHGLDGK